MNWDTIKYEIEAVCPDIESQKYLEFSIYFLLKFNIEIRVGLSM